MGTLLSVVCGPCLRCRRQHCQLSKYLTPVQVQLIQCNWSILKLDLVTLGLVVFLHVVLIRPVPGPKSCFFPDKINGKNLIIKITKHLRNVDITVRPRGMFRVGDENVLFRNIIKGENGSFFETEPDLKMLFPKMIRMNESNQLEWDVDREMLQKHAVTVMEGLGAAVETLNDSHLLNSVLIALGQTHEKRNIKPHMLKKMWPSLHHGLSTVLGEGYTKEASLAWKKLYNYICLQMKIGMENPDLAVDILDDLTES